MNTKPTKQPEVYLHFDHVSEPAVSELEGRTPVLEDKPDLTISGPKNAVAHTLIEGENLHALHALGETHMGLIDLIYIDPPYNTLNTKFCYNDKRGQAEWLSFMERRLLLAKGLLSERGAVFISIDDDEHSHLKLLCDQVFGPEEFIANIIWQKKYTQANDAQFFSDTHDFILCYAQPGFELGRLPRTEKQNARYTNPDNDPRGPWQTMPLHAKSGKKGGAKFSYTFKNGVTWSPPPGTFPAYSAETFQVADEKGQVWFGVDGTATPRMKRYLKEMKDEVVPTTLWLHQDAGHNDEARRELKSFFPDNPFDTPKPVRLINRILRLGSQPDSVILDFFAGSGTTAQAVMELNAEDGGSRECILVTNNEGATKPDGSDGIARSVCYPRIKAVIEGYGDHKGKKAGLKENRLRYQTIELVAT